MYFPSSLSTYLLLGSSMFHKVSSQITFPAPSPYYSKGKGYGPSKGYAPPSPPGTFDPICPAVPEVGEKCNFCRNDNSDCSIRVRILCTYQDGNEKKSCFPPGTDINTNEPDFTWSFTKSECEKGGTDLEYPATITYEMCNFNDEAFIPIGFKNFIKFAPNRRLEAESIIEPANWDSAIGADNNLGTGTCRQYTIERTLKPCENKWRGVAIEMDGNLVKDRPNYCRCFLREYPRSEVKDDGTDPPTPAPTEEGVPKTKQPTLSPVSNSTCDFSQVIITELASPEDSYAKYIELYFLDEECEDETIDVDLKVISYGPGDFEPSNIAVHLKGETINEDGFLTICNSKNAEYIYGRGECGVIGTLISPANLRGTESIAVTLDDDVIDIFGIPGTYASPENKQYFVNGRAVRKINVWDPSMEYHYEDWHVFPQCGQEVGPEAMDINEWKDVQGPICKREANILITEIVDKDVDSYTQVPRYVELYAPRKRHRGMGFHHGLKLVIFHSDSLEPHWPSAVPIDYMPESGFLVVCNKAAYLSYGSECTEVSYNIAGPANSNGNDQIALVSGDEDGWFVVDIYGVIGEDGYDTDHDFLNSRVIRKLEVTETKATWSKYDWQVCKSDIPDPNVWDSDECGSAEDAPSLTPTDSPTPESQKDCEFFFTELADVENVPFIEIKSTCPGITITRDLTVVSWKEYGLSCDVSLKGLVVPDDGFMIICSNKFQHMSEYGGKFDFVGGKWRDLSVCDIEDYMLLAGHGFNSYAIMDKDSDCNKDGCVGSNCYSGCNTKYVDIYGYPGSSLAYTDHVYDDCRAVRKMKFPYGSSPFNPDMWEVICISFSIPTQPGQDPDPRTWKEVPLLLFFTEFCDPGDDKSKRMIELYSPNKRDYKIEDDLIVMKWEGSSPYPSYTFQSLKGRTVDGDGYLVLCMNWYGYGGDTCNLITGYNGIAALSGDEHFGLAGCEFPSSSCDCIDMYGTPGIKARGSPQDFTDGKAFRLRTVPAPRKIFDISHWVVVDDITADQCGAGKTPPPVPAPSAPSGGSKGKGKGKYWLRK